MEAITVKKIGGSLGLIIPEDLAKKEHITANSKVVVKRCDDLTRFWGIHKFKKPTQNIMNEIDEGEEF